MAMAIVQGSTGFPFLSNAMYHYMCNVPLSSLHLSVEEIPDQTARQFAEQVKCFHTLCLFVCIALSTTDSEDYGNVISIHI